MTEQLVSKQPEFRIERRKRVQLPHLRYSPRWDPELDPGTAAWILTALLTEEEGKVTRGRPRQQGAMKVNRNPAGIPG